jgi:hypothetical protein
MSEKVNNLNTLKGTYNGAKTSYIAALNKYNEALKQLNLNNKSPNANNDIIDGGVVITKDKVKMGTTDASKFGTDYLDDTTDEFQSTLTYSGATGGTIYSNQFVQRNLDELTSDVDLKNTDPKVVSDATGLTADISDTTCDMTMFNRCDGYAKMTNRNYYGLSKNDDGCSCYVFDNTLSEANDQFADVDTGLADMNYFGIMFDGGLYYLTKSNYSDNFNNLYDISEPPGSTNTNLIPVDPGSTNIQDSTRNPFTGSGPNTITIHSLGTVGCSEEPTLGTG